MKGEGANWQTTEWREGKGKTKKVCAYHGTAASYLRVDANDLPRTNFGVRVIDITDPTKPVNTAYLTTTSMLDPWESLKINERRQLLGADNGANGGGRSGDRHLRRVRRLPLSAAAVQRSDWHRCADGGLRLPGLTGHEGSWAPDGLTYYGGGRATPTTTTPSTPPIRPSRS